MRGRARANSRRLMLGLIAITLVCLATESVKPDFASAFQPRPDAAGTVWLCRPGQADDPCTASLLTTVVGPGGVTHVVDDKAAKHPPVDCFYLYPNITHQDTPNATLHVDAQETAIAELEASPFSQDCRVYAPMYRERSFVDPGDTSANRVTARSVLSAWNDYLAHFNDGRGSVLHRHATRRSRPVMVPEPAVGAAQDAA